MTAPKVKVEVSSVEARAGATKVNAELRKIIKTVGQLNTSLKGVNTSLRSMGASGGARKAASAQGTLAASTKRSEAQIRKQVRALASASEQFKNLRLRIRQASGDSQLVARLTNSFKALERSLGKGAVKAKAYDRAMLKFKKTQGNITRELKVLNKGAKLNSKSVGGLSNSMKNLGSSAIFAVGPLSGFGARLTAFSAIATRTGVAIAGLAIGVVALGVTFVKLIGGSIRAALEIQNIISTLTVATGSLLGAKDAFQFVTDISLKFGLSLQEAATQFGQLAAAAKGTALEGGAIRKIFLQTSKAAVALGLSVEQTTGIFRALQQMISKGSVQAEELRGQLGERLPGAFQIAAIAMGKTTAELSKMLELGKVLPEKLLPAIGEEFEKRFGKQAVRASENLRAALNRLTTAQFLFSAELDETIGSGKIAAGVLDSLSNVILRLRDNISNIIAATGGLAAGLALLAAPATLRGLFKLGLLIKRLSLTLLGIVAVGTGAAGLVAILVRLTVAVVGGLAVFSSFKESLDETSASQAMLIEQLKDYISVVKESEGATRGAINAQVDLAEKGIVVLRTEIEALNKILATSPGKTFFTGIEAGFRLTGFGSVIADLLGLETVKEVEAARSSLVSLSFELDNLLGKLEELRDLPVTDFGEKLSKSAITATENITKLVTKLENLRDAQTQLKRGGIIGILGAERVGAEAEARDLIRKVPKKELGALFEPLGIDPALLGREEKLVNVLADILLATKSINDENTALIKKLKAIPALYEKQLEALVKQEKSLKGANNVLRLRLQGQKEEADQLKFRNSLDVKFSELSEARLKSLIEEGEINRDLTELWKKQQDAIKAAQKVARDFASTLAQGFEDAMLSANSFKDVLGGVLKTLARIAFNVTVTQPLTKFLTESFQGFRSHGGSVSGGAPVVVGEQGPEIFTPHTSGVIIPNPRTEELLRQRDRDNRDRFPRGAGFNALGPNMQTGPRIVDVTSGGFGRANPAAIAGRVASGIGGLGIGALSLAVTSGLFGRFGVGGANTERPPQVGSAEFRREASLGRIATEMNRTTQNARDTLGLFSTSRRPGFVDAPRARATFDAGERAFTGGAHGFGGGLGRGQSPTGTDVAGTPFALGGAISAGQRATVGEVGPELFIPSGGGGGRTVVINQNFDFTGASVEAIALLQQAAAQIKQDTMNAIQLDALQAGPMSKLGR